MTIAKQDEPCMKPSGGFLFSETLIHECFWDLVEKTDSCWIWRGKKTHMGYGDFRIGRRSFRAHRVAYTLLIGPIPEGLKLLHSCDVKACVNPDHLRPGTDADNSRDAILRDRRPNGARIANAKLNDESIMVIRTCAEFGASHTELAEAYGITVSNVGHIVKRRTWKHVL